MNLKNNIQFSVLFPKLQSYFSRGYINLLFPLSSGAPLKQGIASFYPQWLAIVETVNFARRFCKDRDAGFGNQRVSNGTEVT